MGFFRFLKSLRTLARNGDITIDEAYKFARQEFGEVTDLLKLQTNKIFKEADAPSIKLPKKGGEVIEASFKPGKSKYRDKVIEESPSQKSGIMATNKTDEFNLSKDDPFGDLEKIVKGQDDTGLPKNPFRPGGSLDQVTGITRGLARKILARRGIEIGKNDPIEVFIDTFGESITDVKNLAEEMVEADAMGRNLKSADELLEIEGLYDIEIPKNPSKGLTDEEMSDIAKEIEREDILLKFDPEDREPNAMGGINRTNFRKGGIKLAKLLATKGKDLAEEIKKSVKNIFTTDDIKYDADVAVDDMLENLNIDRDTIDQKDLIEAYGMAYDELKIPLLEKLKLKNKPKRSFRGTEIKDPKFDENMPFDNDAEKLAEIKMSNERFEALEGVDPRDTILPTGNLVSKQLKVMRLAEQIQPGLFEKLNDTQLDIITKYGDMIDDNLLKQIVLDPDPNNQALAIASIEEAKTMIDKGMDVDEILRLQAESLNRKKNAQGGLNYLMGF